jgi:hypothetical protein
MMASPVNPLRTPEAFDSCKIAGIVTPGLVEVTGLRIKNKWNVWSGMGIEHPIINYTGRDIDAFQIEIRLFDEDALDTYQQTIEPLLLKLPFGGKVGDGSFKYRPFDFSHPITAAAGIRSVVVEEYNQIVQTEDGLWVARETLRPFWGRPKVKVAKPIASGDEKPKPEDARDRTILALSDQISALGKAVEKERGP